MQISIKFSTDLFWQDKHQNLFNLGDKNRWNIIKTDLIILPEMFNTGFSPSSVLLAESNEWSYSIMMKERAKEKCVIAGSLIIVEEKNIIID